LSRTDEKLIRLLRHGAWGGADDGTMKEAADRIEALTARLAKAVETLEFISDDLEAGLETVTLKARATLAEIGGEG